MAPAHFLSKIPERWLRRGFEFARAWIATHPLAWWQRQRGSRRRADNQSNLAAFDDVWLRRRIASAPGERPDTAVSILGSPNAIPVLLAPTGPVEILHPEAELPCGRAAQEAGVTSIVSTDTHYSFPEIAANWALTVGAAKYRGM